MSTLDILSDGFPHGTPDGFRQGCRSSACPAVIPCRTVHTRYSGDFTFAKLINAGVPLTEILERDAASRAGARDRDNAAAREARRAETAATRPKRTPKQPRPPREKAPRTAAPARDRTPAAPAAPRPQTNIPTPRTHPGYTWLTTAREKMTSLPLPQAQDRDRALDDYEAALDRHVIALTQWRLELRRRRAQLRTVRGTLDTATTASRSGLSLGGAIAEALQTATRDHDSALTSLAAHLEHRPTEPGKPRPPRVAAQPSSRELQPHGTNACRARGCDRPECIEAGRTYHREWMARRNAKDIPPEHHGTAYGYQLGCKDRANCPADLPCPDASLAEERRRRREAGIPEQAARVPAEPVRQQIRALMTAGWTILAISATANVSKTGIKILLYGRSGPRKGELPAAIEAEKATRIMALAEIPQHTASAS